MERRRRPGIAPGTESIDEPAIRDAQAIAARDAEDEAAADRARLAFRRDGLPALEPDARIAPLLAPGERVIAIRRGALLDRRQPRAADMPLGLAGDLYVTSTRVALVGRTVLSWPLREIEEVVVAGGRLLLVLGDGRGVFVAAAGPRLLRVQIAAARAALAPGGTPAAERASGAPTAGW